MAKTAEVVGKIDFGEVGEFAVVGLVEGGVFELELFEGIGDPTGTKGFPGAEVDAAFTEESPHCHFNGAGIGGGHDTAKVILRNA